MLSFGIFDKPMALKRLGFGLSCSRILGHSFMNSDGTNADCLPRIRKCTGCLSATACEARHRETKVFRGGVPAFKKVPQEIQSFSKARCLQNAPLRMLSNVNRSDE